MAQRPEGGGELTASGAEGGDSAMPPPNLNVNLSDIKDANITGVKYDMRTKHKTKSVQNINTVQFNLTGEAVREMHHLGMAPPRLPLTSGDTPGEAVREMHRLSMAPPRLPLTSGDTPVSEAAPDEFADLMTKMSHLAKPSGNTKGRPSEEEVEPAFPTALLDCKITTLKEDFVETNFFRNLERRLLDQGVAIVVGPTGEGKSSNAIMLCHRLRGEGYLSTYFESLEEIDIESIARYKRNLCVVIDNVFGTSILDTANLGRWCRVLSNLIAVQTAGRQGGGQGAKEEGRSCGRKSLLLLLLSRDNVFSEAVDKATQLPSILKNEALRLCMKSADYLQKEEKKELLTRYAGKTGRVPSEEEENAILSSNAPIGFPQACRLYNELESFRDKPIEFFSKPTALLLDTLKEMMREDAMVRAAFVLLVLQGGSVSLQSLQHPAKREACGINAALQIIRKGLGHMDSEDEDCQQLLKTFGTLCRGLLTQERGRVSFSHDSVRDAVCVVIADTNLPFVAEHFSLSVLSQCIVLDDSSKSSFCQIQNQSVLAVPREMWSLFMERLVSEMEKGKLGDVFTCNLMTNPLFCSELAAAVCLKSKLVPDIVHGVDVDCGLNFLFWASMASPDFLTNLSTSCNFRDWELWQGIIGSCIRGHSELIKRMHSSLQSNSTEDWSIPISIWFGKHRTEVDEGAGCHSRRRPSSTYCRWDNLPVGRHAIPGTVAAEHGHVSVLKTLVELGMPADVRDPQQCTPLMSACSGGQKEVIAFLVTSYKGDLTAADSRGSTPLHKLAEGGHDDIACWLVEKLMDDHVLNETVNKANGELQTPVMLACRYATKFARLLLAKGAETGKEDQKKKSCLHFAAEAGEPGLLQKLVDLKAMDVNQVSRSGWSPLHFACSRPNNFEAVQILLRHGAEVKPRDNSYTETPVHVAVRQGFLETVQALVESGSDVLAACESVNTTSPFLLACEKGNVEVVRYLHGRKADVFRKDHFQQSALHFAARGGNVDTVKYVMDETGVSVNTRNKYGQTPLLVACENGRVEVVKCLREKKADTAVVDNYGYTALHWAAKSGNVDTVKYVMDETGVSVNTRNKDGQTPLLVACLYDRVEVVKYLREKKADTAVVDNDGYTALHWAAKRGNVDLVQYVMDEIGVSVNTRNKYGQTALMLACWYDRVEVVKYLREKKADTAVVDNYGYTALHLAVMRCNVDTVKYVTDETGVNVNTRNKDGQTPLMLAYLYYRVEVVKYLRDRQADTAVVDNDGNTALHWAARGGNVDTVKYVMDETGVSVNTRNKYGHTPLLVACKKGRVEVVKYLRDRQADTAVVDNDGDTALHFAARSGNVDTVRYLVEDAGMKVGSKNFRCETPLSMAQKAGHAAVMDYLSEKVQHFGDQSGPGGETRGRRRPQCVLQ